MLLRLMLLIPLLRQFLLLEQYDVDLGGSTAWTARMLGKLLKATAGWVDWRDPSMVNTAATIRLRLGPFYKLVSRPVYVIEVTHGDSIRRYYLTMRGKLYEDGPGGLDGELNAVDLEDLSYLERADLMMALD